ncbi:hypothetical protein Micbo1qcDRAFT_197422 [Microdochium bolleyi]|uniref:Uncharacterized protein n=1 Tax=Microdochium bolleyi TaxID=196109 RepID=A0A136ITD8_9PEZI|nr:hypothetical protein Micbo1qcDRAFT_197422 [Microdochium bolleyi]
MHKEPPRHNTWWHQYDTRAAFIREDGDLVRFEIEVLLSAVHTISTDSNNIVPDTAPLSAACGMTIIDTAMSKKDPIVIMGSSIFGLSTALLFARRSYGNVTVPDKHDYNTSLLSHGKGTRKHPYRGLLLISADSGPS